MNDNSEQIAATLKRSLCESFAVRADGADRWVIRSPFLFSDGDAVPATLVLGAGGQFCLTDEGMAASHLFFDDFAYTDARFNRIEMLADAHGAVIGPDRDVVMVLDGVPSAFDIADFLALMSQIQGVALTTRTERDQARFVTTVRTQIERLRDMLQRAHDEIERLNDENEALRIDLAAAYCRMDDMEGLNDE